MLQLANAIAYLCVQALERATEQYLLFRKIIINSIFLLLPCLAFGVKSVEVAVSYRFCSACKTIECSLAERKKERKKKNMAKEVE